jgi:hypothetical protein
VDQAADAYEDPDRALDHIRWLINQGKAFDQAASRSAGF